MREGAHGRRTIRLTVSAFPDGATSYIVTIAEPETGRTQTIEGVYASSEDEAINRVIDVLERNAKRDLGESAYVTRGPLTFD